MQALSLESVTDFLTKKLGIHDWEQKFQENKLELLKEVVRNYITNPDYAFQNLTLASILPEKRRNPTRESSVNQCLNSLRGMCIDHNYFMAVLFKSLGYDTFVVGSTVSVLPMPMNHPLCIINLDDGLWLVDLGMGSVFNQPIPLHQLPFSFQVAGYTCEYRKVNENGIDVYGRFHVKGDPMKGDFDVPEERRYHFNLRPMEYEEFNDPMKIIFTDSDVSFFLNMLYAFRYVFSNSDGFQAVVFMGTTLILFSGTEIQKTLFDSYEEMADTFEKYFPKLSMIEYKEATKYFKTSQNRKNIVSNTPTETVRL